MKTRILLIVIFLSFSSILYSQEKNKLQTGKIPENEIIQQTQDSLIFQQTVDHFSGEKNLPIGELIIAIGKSFEGTPYVAHTLENGSDEKLVINLREFDCTTFAENCLALAITIKSETPSYEKFKQTIQQIRYRDGKRNLYPSRLHYFSEWLSNNAAKNIITLPKTAASIPFPDHVNFMSTHPDSYDCIKAHPEFIGQMAQIEKNISAKSYYYIPKDKIADIENELQDGDIAGITTNIDGLDMVHTILLTRVNGHIHLLHASSKAKKVVLSEEPLAEYLAQHKIHTGIMIGRPIY